MPAGGAESDAQHLQDGVTDLHRIDSASIGWNGRDAGELSAIRPAVAFGFSSVPRSPAWHGSAPPCFSRPPIGTSPHRETGGDELVWVGVRRGWSLTAWPRFTRNPPAPASDIPRVKQGIRSTAGMIRTILIVSALGVAALVLFTPNGGSPETLPMLGMLVIWPLGLAAGLTYTQRLMMNSAELYARWLEHR